MNDKTSTAQEYAMACLDDILASLARKERETVTERPFRPGEVFYMAV